MIEDEMPDRKASDILLELEEKINNLEKNMKNIENILQSSYEWEKHLIKTKYFSLTPHN